MVSGKRLLQQTSNLSLSLGDHLPMLPNFFSFVVVVLLPLFFFLCLRWSLKRSLTVQFFTPRFSNQH